jgi:hypothetical protein
MYIDAYTPLLYYTILYYTTQDILGFFGKGFFDGYGEILGHKRNTTRHFIIFLHAMAC